MKALNKQNAAELTALILSLDPTNGAASIAEIEASKESVAKKRQAMINCAAGLLPEDQEFDGAKPKETAADKKFAANVETVTKAGFVANGDTYSKEGALVTFTTEELRKMSAKQVEARLNPKAPKVAFTGYTEEEMTAFKANVGHLVTLELDGVASEGVIKTLRIYKPTGRALYDIKVGDKVRTTAVTNKTLVVGELAPPDPKAAEKEAAKVAADKAREEKKAAAEKAKAEKEAEKKAKADAKAEAAAKAKVDNAKVKGATDANDKPAK